MLSIRVKFVQTDRQMDKWTMANQYAPDLSMRGHKNSILLPWQSEFLMEPNSVHIFFLKRTPQGKFLPSLVQTGPVVWKEKMCKEIVDYGQHTMDEVRQTPGDPKSSP